MEDKRYDTLKFTYGSELYFLMKKEEARIEKLRGTGVCMKCDMVSLDIEKEFRVTHPLTMETKLSLLCKACRKIVVKKMMRDNE